MRIQRTRRKTLGLQVKEGEVIVKAPLFASDEAIEAFVRKYGDWIQKQLERQKGAKRRFVFGERFWYLGQSYELKESQEEFVFDGRYFLAKEPSAELFARFYKERAKAYIPPLVERLAKEYGESYRKVGITSAHTRWGSCSSQKNLNFSYRLMMLPPEAIEYVVIHELSHLRHMNHSKAFWELVHSRMPNYKEMERVLTQFEVISLKGDV